MNRISLLALCGLATLLDGYDIQALGLAVPAMAVAFQVDVTTFAAAFSASLAGMAAGALAMAPLGDRVGRKTMIMLALIVVGVMTGAVMTSTTVLELAGWRFAAGIGMGAIIPLAVTIAAESAPQASRTTIVTLIASCAGVGSFAAGFLAPTMEHHFGWRGIFALGALLPIATALAFGFWNSYLPKAPTGFIVQRPVRGLSGILNPVYRFRTLLIWAIFLTSLLATYSLISWLPTLLGNAGWARGEAQQAAGFLALGSIMGGMLLAVCVDRGGPVRGLMTGFVAAATALGALGLLPTDRSTWIVLLVIIGAGAIGSQLALGSLAASFYPAELRATGLGWASGLGRVGSIAGPLLLALMIHARLPTSVVIASLALPLVFCALCVAALPKALANDKPHPSNERAP